MAIQMTKLCEAGVDLIWRQCDEEQFPRGIEYLEEAVRAGDPEALFFLGFCFSWGAGGVGFNDKKAYECYREGARAGSFRCVPGAIRAGQYDDALKNASRHTAEESYEAVFREARRGDAVSAFQLGLALEWEDPCLLALRPDMRAADCLAWYERAAEGDIVDAAVKAGKCYTEGRFVGKNPEKAVYYANKAASQGNAWGLYHMGLHQQEKGDDAVALEYFLAASRQGDRNAPYQMGQMYLTGKAGKKDVRKAIEALETAADRDNTECLLELGDIFYEDCLVERDNERAFFWYSRAYSVGEKRAALPLGHLYLTSWEKQDYQKAEKLLREAAETEQDGSASLTLGNLYRFGMGREPDMEQALLFYESGAQKGNAECMEILGNLYYQGEEVDENYEKSFYWLEKCRQNGTLQSYASLGYLYLKGYGCEIDEELAHQLLEVAVESDLDGYASYALGYLYERRGETQEELELAAEYYQSSIDMGNESAMRRFSHFKKNVFGKWKVVY